MGEGLITYGYKCGTCTQLITKYNKIFFFLAIFIRAILLVGSLISFFVWLKKIKNESIANRYVLLESANSIKTKPKRLLFSDFFHRFWCFCRSFLLRIKPKLPKMLLLVPLIFLYKRIFLIHWFMTCEKNYGGVSQIQNSDSSILHTINSYFIRNFKLIINQVNKLICWASL